MFFDTTDLLVDLLIGAGAGYLGYKAGENRTHQAYENRARDAEINELRRQLDELKRQQNKP